MTWTKQHKLSFFFPTNLKGGVRKRRRPFSLPRRKGDCHLPVPFSAFFTIFRFHLKLEQNNTILHNEAALVPFDTGD
jgi:hypothetical protein